MLQTHKWRRPKWIKLPRQLLEDERWFGLSTEAKAAWVSILLIAGENPGSKLPPLAILFRRLQTLGNCFQLKKFEAIISELNQCGFLVKTTPELQSYRASELQKDKKEEKLNSCPTEDQKPSWSTPTLTEITGTPDAYAIQLKYAGAQGLFRPIRGRFDRH